MHINKLKLFWKSATVFKVFIWKYQQIVHIYYHMSYSESLLFVKHESSNTAQTVLFERVLIIRRESHEFLFKIVKSIETMIFQLHLKLKIMEFIVK